MTLFWALRAIIPVLLPCLHMYSLSYCVMHVSYCVMHLDVNMLHMEALDYEEDCIVLLVSN